MSLKIKKLSYADYKNIMKGIAGWNTNNKVAIQCSGSQDTINGINNYISQLTSKINSSTNKVSNSNSKKENTFLNFSDN